MTHFNSIEKLCAAVCVVAIAVGAPAQDAEKAQRTGKAKYKLVDLGPSGPAGQPFHITNNGLISAAIAAADGTDHSFVYVFGRPVDISRPGLRGANSMPFGNNAAGQVVGGANTNLADPGGEDFCGFQTLGLPSGTTTCLPFLWQNGRMIALPTLDRNQGNNGVANAINDRGEVTGAAENTTFETSCSDYAPTLAQFQRYQFKPVVWRRGGVTELATVPGDGVGTGLAINNKGQVAGSSGDCSVFNVQFLIPIHPLHALFWEEDGTPIEIPSFGGIQPAFGNSAMGINDSGQVVGFSTLPDNVTFHGFLWNQHTGRLVDLGTAAGMPSSAAIAINDSGVAVGVSQDSMNLVATVWEHQKAEDLNTLIPDNSPLYLLIACSINAEGQIIGLAADSSGVLHGFELDPQDEPR
jgi:probable HAF family extracellular repeat protein